MTLILKKIIIKIVKGDKQRKGDKVMSKRTRMEALARSVEEKKNTVYFTENHPNAGVDDSLWGYKYFLLYKNTFGTFRKYRTQEEAIDDMKEILKEE